MTNRTDLVRRGFYLSALTVAWNIVEGVVALSSGLIAGSVALVGFGMDSFIETASAIVVGWRFRVEMNGRSGESAEKAERLAARITGALLLTLALFILFDSARSLLGYGAAPAPSWIGMTITAISLAVMPLLARAKLRTAEKLGSRSLRADAYETITCAWLSATTLAGLLLNALIGWWWADPLAALGLIPWIVREGLEGWRGECHSCGEDEKDSV